MEWIALVKLRNFFMPSLKDFVEFPNVVTDADDFLKWAALRRAALKDAREQVSQFSPAFAKVLATSMVTEEKKAEKEARDKKEKEEEIKRKKSDTEKKLSDAVMAVTGEAKEAKGEDNDDAAGKAKPGMGKMARMKQMQENA